MSEYYCRQRGPIEDPQAPQIVADPRRVPERERHEKEQLNSGRLPKSKNSTTPEQRESRPMSIRFNMQTGRVSEHVDIPQYQHTVRTYAAHLTAEGQS